MALYIELTPKALQTAKMSAEQHGISVGKLITEFCNLIFSGDAGYLILQPAPPPELMEKIKQAVASVMPIKDQGDKHGGPILPPGVN